MAGDIETTTRMNRTATDETSITNMVAVIEVDIREEKTIFLLLSCRQFVIQVSCFEI